MINAQTYYIYALKTIWLYRDTLKVKDFLSKAFKICIAIWITEQGRQLRLHSNIGINIQTLIHCWQNYNKYIQHVEHGAEVGETDFDDLQGLFDNVVDDEHDVDELAGHDEVVKITNVSQQFYCLNVNTLIF